MPSHTRLHRESFHANMGRAGKAILIDDRTPIVYASMVEAASPLSLAKHVANAARTVSSCEIAEVGKAPMQSIGGFAIEFQNLMKLRTAVLYAACVLSARLAAASSSTRSARKTATNGSLQPASCSKIAVEIEEEDSAQYQTTDRNARFATKNPQ